MAFDNELINDVLNNADIVKVVSSYITLTKKGRNYVGVCPFHDDTNPSLTVSPEKKIFKCFVCGTSGSAISFVQKFEKISFFEAMKKVAEISGYSDSRLDKAGPVKKIDEEKEPYLKCLTDLTLYYQYALGTHEGQEGLQYFEERNLGADLRNKYRLGYAFKDGKATIDFLVSKGHSLKIIDDLGLSMISSGVHTDKNQGRIIFPICDTDGYVVGFSARRIKDGPEAKYVNSPETVLFHKSSILYNYHIAKEKARIDGYIYVLEGFMDVFALSRIGIDSAVAIMGTALTKEHIKLLRNLNVEVRLCLDGDLPGQKATMEASKLLIKEGIPCRIVDNQNSKRDPDEILNEEGEGTLRLYLTNLLDRIDFSLNFFKQSNPLNTIQEKKKLVLQFVPILVNLKSGIELDDYIRKLSSITGFDQETIRDLVEKTRLEVAQGKSIKTVYETFKPERKALRKLDFAERELLYLMLTNVSAIDFYEANLGYFYDEVYHQIANYLVELAKETGSVSIVSIISILEESDVSNKDVLMAELTQLILEKNHSNLCTDELLANLLEVINDEKSKIFEKDSLEASMRDKTPLEQARILADYNRKKMKK